MTLLAFTAGDAAYWGLAIFLVAIGLAAAFMLFRLGQAFERLSSFIRGTERDLLPVIVKAGSTVDRVNYQLDKADTVTDSAVSMADSADTAVRAISTVITTPVEKISGLAAGVTHGFSQFRKTKSFAGPVEWYAYDRLKLSIDRADVVVIDPAVVEYFPDPDAVNDALRGLAAIIKRQQKAEKTTAHRRAPART